MKTKYIFLIINHSITGTRRRNPQIYPLPNPAGRAVQAPSAAKAGLVHQTRRASLLTHLRAAGRLIHGTPGS